MAQKAKDVLQQKYFQNLILQNEEMRHASFLTDVKLTCQGKEFSAHKIILCAASPALREHFQQNPNTATIFMDFLKPKTLEIILKFFYTGRIDVTGNSSNSILLKDLLEASRKFQIPSIYDYCLEILIGCDSNERFVSHWKTLFDDDDESDEVKQGYLERLQQNLGVLQTTHSFHNLTAEQLNSLLILNVANPLNQQEILSAIVSWIKYDQSGRLHTLTSFLEKVDFSLLDHSYLRTLTEDPILKENLYFYKQCSNIFFHEITVIADCVLDSLAGTSSASSSKASTSKASSSKDFDSEYGCCSKSVTSSTPQLDSFAEQSTKRLKRENQESTPGMSGDTSRRILCYDRYKKGIIEFKPQRKAWIEIKNEILDDSFSKAKLSAVCNAGKCIYFFGGKNSQEATINKCYKLDLSESKFLEISPMKEKRYNAYAQKVDHNIYVIGGLSSNLEDKVTYVSSIERYNLNSKTWDLFIKIPFSHPNPAKAVVIEDRLCLIGISNLMWYNLNSDEWVEGELLPVKLLHCTSLSVGQGGRKLLILQEYLKKIYCFDLYTKSWDTYLLPSYVDWSTDIINLQQSTALEFLVVCSKKSFLYRPPYSWELVSEISSAFPHLFEIEQDLTIDLPPDLKELRKMFLDITK